jgi:hypothetical protein
LAMKEMQIKMTQISPYYIQNGYYQ